MIKKLIGGQNYFRKMLSTCLLVISVTIFILTVFFYQRYADSLSKNLYDGQEKNLEKSARTMNDLVSEISQLYNTVILDSRVVGFSSLKEFDPAENYATYLIVKKFYNINPYVSSLYIYNATADDAITCGSYRFNLDYCWEYLKEAKKASVFPSPLTGTSEEALTFAYPVYADNFDELSGGIFINLDMKKLSEHVLGTGSQAGMVLGDNGMVLLSDLTEDFTSDPEACEAFLAWPGLTEGESASSLRTFHGDDYLCAFYKDPAQNFTFLSGVPYSEIVGPMKVQRNLSLAVAAAIFLTAILLQYIITKRLYRPLEAITEELRDSKYAGGSDMDEFSLIRHVYENAIDEIRELEEENAFYQPRMKSDLIRGLVLGNRDIAQTKELLEKNGWEIPFEGMFLACFFIENSDSSDVLAPIVQTRISQHLHETLSPLFYTECVPVASDQVICLINTIEGIPITFDELVRLLEAAKDELLTDNHLVLTISLDGVTSGIEDLNRVYRRVLELKNYRFVLGTNQIIYPGRVMELMPEYMTYPDKLADEILACMLHGKQKEFTENVQEFLSILKQYSYQPASLLFNRLYLDLLFQMQKLNAPDKDSYLSAETLHTPATLTEGAGVLLTIFEWYQERKAAAEQLKDNKHFEQIEESRKYIEEHYNDYNLSAGMVAEYLGYSTNYFSRIFKSITGFYINDYIRQIRIVKAQELLMNSDMTITTIAEATGFSNPNYFYSIFKKETGLTPAAYRNAGQRNG